MSATLTGFGLGFVVAAVLGPIGLLTIRTVLRGATASGIAIGAGAAVIDGTYALLGALGAGAALQGATVQLVVGLVGCTFLAVLGLKTLHASFRVRLGGEADEEVLAPRRAFLTSLAATASNPSTILSWAAVFAAASSAGADGPVGLLVLGVVLGTATWFTLLSLVLHAVRSRFTERVLRVVDAGAGIGILGFAGVLGVRAVDR